MSEYVTGPGVSKVYVRPGYVRQAVYSSTSPSVYRGWNRVNGRWIHIANPLGVTATRYTPARDETQAVRNAIQLWNQKYRETEGMARRREPKKLMEMTTNYDEADILVQDTEPGEVPEDEGWAGLGEYPTPGQKEFTTIREGHEGSEYVIAHELGHNQGLKHHHQGEARSVMKYQGQDKGATNAPTKFDVKKVANKKSPEQGRLGIQASGGAGADNSGGGPKQAKSKTGTSRAKDRSVTGGGGRKVAK